MTKLLSQTVMETYRNVFGHVNTPEDHKRIDFLEQAVEGIVFRQGIPVKLEDALYQAEKKDPDSAASRDYRAVYALREAYLNPKELNKESLMEALTEADLYVVIDSINDCVKVLVENRKKDLLASFDKAFAVRSRTKINPLTGKEYNVKEQAIYAAAEASVKTGIPEVVDYVITKMAQYQREKKAA